MSEIDHLRREVARLHDGPTRGPLDVVIPGAGPDGPLPAGVYLLSAHAGAERASRRVVLLP